LAEGRVGFIPKYVVLDECGEAWIESAVDGGGAGRGVHVVAGRPDGAADPRQRQSAAAGLLEFVLALLFSSRPFFLLEDNAFATAAWPLLLAALRRRRLPLTHCCVGNKKPSPLEWLDDVGKLQNK